MIDVGVCDCDHPRGAELVRILINHPDVELKWVTGSNAGQPIARVVSGIVGECDLTLSSEGPLDEVDVVFLCQGRQHVDACLQALALPPTTRVIDLSGSHNLDTWSGGDWTYGMGEMQRRVLVHDAHHVAVPGNAAAVALLALMPMARNLLVNSPVKLEVEMGAAAFGDGPVLSTDPDGIPLERWTGEQRQEVALVLQQCQSSFDQPVEMSITPVDGRRWLAVKARVRCGMDGDSVRQLYEEYYDDHNFVFMVDRRPVAADVENTNKCLIYLDKDDQTGMLTVHAMMDLLLKGSAGTAVHMMNLLFGLHERAGLALKGSGC